jgi:type IV pilus assembly protein PilM
MMGLIQGWIIGSMREKVLLSGLLSDKSKQQLSGWLNSANSQFAGLLQSFSKESSKKDMVGLVINPQYLKLLKIGLAHNQYEVENFNIVDLPEGLMNDLEVKDGPAIAAILKQMIADSGLEVIDVVLSIPRSSAIVKTITVDNRLHPDEVESRVWLEADRLFPSLIGDIYLDFANNGPSSHDPSQEEILIVACRKVQLNQYLDIVRLAGLNPKVVDVNYYAYERALSLIIQRPPEMKTVAFLNINYRLIDLLVVHEGKLVYTHELSYDGHHLLKLRDFADNDNASPENAAPNEILKNSLGLHLKHTLQFFYSSKPNIRLERIILGGDVPANLSGVLEYVSNETGKEVVLANPFVDMKFEANVDQVRLSQYASSLMLCCGLALTCLEPIHKPV